MRAEYARSFNAWLEWAKQNPKESSYPASEEDMKKRLAFGVCVPHGNAQFQTEIPGHLQKPLVESATGQFTSSG